MLSSSLLVYSYIHLLVWHYSVEQNFHSFTINVMISISINFTLFKWYYIQYQFFFSKNNHMDLGNFHSNRKVHTNFQVAYKIVLFSLGCHWNPHRHQIIIFRISNDETVLTLYLGEKPAKRYFLISSFFNLVLIFAQNLVCALVVGQPDVWCGQKARIRPCCELYHTFIMAVNF